MFFDVIQSASGFPSSRTDMNWPKLAIPASSVCSAAIRIALLASAAVCMSGPASKLAAGESQGDIATVDRTGMSKMSPDQIEKRGKELRAALQQTYEELVASRKMSGLETDITQYVKPYIYAGMMFDEAESILKAAGFHIDPRPAADRANDPNSPKDWYAVLASISPFVQRFMGKVSADVMLLPRSPGDYSVVDSVRASFFVSMP
jgi:hypothetical protein